MMARRLWPWLLLLGCVALAAWLRLGLIEQPPLAHACLQAGGQDTLCTVRDATIWLFMTPTLTVATVAALVLMLLWRHPLAAGLSAALGIFALTLYCVYPGVIAVVLGVLRLARCQSQPSSSRAVDT